MMVHRLHTGENKFIVAVVGKQSGQTAHKHATIIHYSTREGSSGFMSAPCRKGNTEVVPIENTCLLDMDEDPIKARRSLV